MIEPRTMHRCHWSTVIITSPMIDDNTPTRNVQQLRLLASPVDIIRVREYADITYNVYLMLAPDWIRKKETSKRAHKQQ